MGIGPGPYAGPGGGRAHMREGPLSAKASALSPGPKTILEAYVNTHVEERLVLYCHTTGVSTAPCTTQKDVLSYALC